MKLKLFFLIKFFFQKNLFFPNNEECIWHNSCEFPINYWCVCVCVMVVERFFQFYNLRKNFSIRQTSTYTHLIMMMVKNLETFNSRNSEIFKFNFIYGYLFITKCLKWLFLNMMMKNENICDIHNWLIDVYY